MPYALQLKSAVFPIAKLRDGVGFSAPVRTLSEAYAVPFDNLPDVAVGDPNISWREISTTEAMVLRDDMAEAIERAALATQAHRAAAQAKIDARIAAAKVQPTKAGPKVTAARIA